MFRKTGPLIFSESLFSNSLNVASYVWRKGFDTLTLFSNHPGINFPTVPGHLAYLAAPHFSRQRKLDYASALDNEFIAIVNKF